jgi:hypothetical protein
VTPEEPLAGLPVGIDVVDPLVLRDGVPFGVADRPRPRRLDTAGPSRAVLGVGGFGQRDPFLLGQHAHGLAERDGAPLHRPRDDVPWASHPKHRGLLLGFTSNDSVPSSWNRHP